MKNNNLINARKNKKLTQTELAKKVGVTQAMISKYELGSDFPSFQVAVKISKVLDVSTDIFMNEKIAG